MEAHDGNLTKKKHIMSLDRCGQMWKTYMTRWAEFSSSLTVTWIHKALCLKIVYARNKCLLRWYILTLWMSYYDCQRNSENGSACACKCTTDLEKRGNQKSHSATETWKPEAGFLQADNLDGSIKMREKAFWKMSYIYRAVQTTQVRVHENWLVGAGEEISLCINSWITEE